MKKLFLIILGLCLCTALYADMNTYIIGSGTAPAGGGACTSTEYSNTSPDTDLSLVFRSTRGWYGYMFTVGETGRTVCKVSGYFNARVGTPSPGTFHAEIWSVTSDEPNAQVGGDSDSVNFSLIPTDATDTEIDLSWSSDKPSISASTAYYVLFVPDWVMDTSSYCKGRYKNGEGIAVEIVYGTSGSWAHQDSTGSGRVYYEE